MSCQKGLSLAMILRLVSYLGTVFGFLFLTLSIASGLYYISEVVEEHTERTRRVLTRCIYAIIAALVSLMVFDRFPVKLTLFAVASHIIYYSNLENFPYISVKSARFIASGVCVVLNHYLWFRHFNNVHVPAQFRDDPNYIAPRRATFAEIASFFGICVWFIPFALFVSLSAGEYVLPTSEAKKKDKELGKLQRKTTGLARVVINAARAYLRSVAELFGKDTQGRLV